MSIQVWAVRKRTTVSAYPTPPRPSIQICEYTGAILIQTTTQCFPSFQDHWLQMAQKPKVIRFCFFFLSGAPILSQVYTNKSPALQRVSQLKVLRPARMGNEVLGEVRDSVAARCHGSGWSPCTHYRLPGAPYFTRCPLDHPFRVLMVPLMSFLHRPFNISLWNIFIFSCAHVWCEMRVCASAHVWKPQNILGYWLFPSTLRWGFVVCRCEYQARWPHWLLGILLSLSSTGHSNTEIANTCHHAWLHVGSGDLNLGPCSWVASVWSTEWSP